MKVYIIEYAPSIWKKLSKLPMDVQPRIIQAINGLAHNRFPPGAEKMTNVVARYKLRVGAYRIIYECHHDQLIVVVLDVDDRKQVYRR
jgi:mRNA interferase RelE/StbE